jgi:hypothetical protein
VLPSASHLIDLRPRSTPSTRWSSDTTGRRLPSLRMSMNALVQRSSGKLAAHSGASPVRNAAELKAPDDAP